MVELTIVEKEINVQVGFTKSNSLLVTVHRYQITMRSLKISNSGCEEQSCAQSPIETAL